MIEPQYQELLSKDIPHVERDGVTAIVIAGEAFDTKVGHARPWPFRAPAPLWYDTFPHATAPPSPRSRPCTRGRPRPTFTLR